MITRYHPVLSVPVVTIRGMAGDQETVTAAAAVTAGGDLVPRAGARPPGPVAIAAELLARTRAELPVLAGLGEREDLLAAAWLASLRAPRTRRAYAGDVRGWLGWLAERGTDVLDAGRVHVDLWAAAQQDHGAEAASVRRRLSALSSFYRYCAAHDLVDRIPTAGVARPVVDPDYTATIGLDRDQVRVLVAAADADRGPQALRTAAVIRLLVHNALRVDEACAADVTDLGADAGHLGAAGDPQRRPAGESTTGPGDGGRAGRLPYGPGPPPRGSATRGSWPARCWPPPAAAASARATCGTWGLGTMRPEISAKACASAAPGWRAGDGCISRPRFGRTTG